MNAKRLKRSQVKRRRKPRKAMIETVRLGRYRDMSLSFMDKSFKNYSGLKPIDKVYTIMKTKESDL